MKNRMLMIVIIVVAIVVLVMGAWYVLFMHFGIGPVFPFADVKTIEIEMPTGNPSAAEPLMTLTDSEESARVIAEQYGITFVSFQEGVATYYTDEDPNQVISRGEENGYPTLYINYPRELFDS